MKYCKYCGSEVKEEQRFCNKCGREILRLNQVNNKDNEEGLKKKEVGLLKEEFKMEHTIEEIKNHNKHLNNNSTNNKYNKKSNDKKGKNNIVIKIIITGVLLVFIIIASIYFTKNIILPKYYNYKITEATTIKDKLENYNKLIKYKDNLDNEILELLKTDISNLKHLDKMDNIDEIKKDNMKAKIFLIYAEEEYNKKNYDKAIDYFEQAKLYGYDIKSSDIYKKIEEMKKEKEKKNQQNESDLNVKFDENLMDDFRESQANFDNEEKYNISDDYIIEDSYYRYLTKDELKKYDKYTLSLIRNEIYARRGYAFQTEPFKSYFNSKEWYVKDPSFKGEDGELNVYELKNVYLIKSLEES